MQPLYPIYSLPGGARCIKIDKISVRVTKVNGASSPRLRGRRLDPGFHQTPQSNVFGIDVCDLEFQDCTSVPCRISRAGHISFLGLRREDSKYSRTRVEFDVIFTGPLCFDPQNGLVKLNKLVYVVRDQTSMH